MPKLTKRASVNKVASAVQTFITGMVDDSGGECPIDEDLRWNLEAHDGQLYAVCGERRVLVTISAEEAP